MSAPLLTSRLSVAIITHNEEQNLPRTLASVAWADEIVIVDSGSTDATLDIAREFSAHGINLRIIERPWPGFAAQKNFAIAQCTGDWVLSLDADEKLTPELQHEVRTLLSEPPLAQAFFIRRRNLFLDRWIKHGGFYPDAKLRLFRRGVAQFEDRPVHETIVFQGEAATLNNDLVHHAYPTLSTYIEHMERYSTLGAEILVAKGRTSASWLAFITNVWLVPQIMLQWNYFFRGGFLDGREGLLLHLYQAVYTSWKYAKAWEKSRS